MSKIDKSTNWHYKYIIGKYGEEVKTGQNS